MSLLCHVKLFRQTANDRSHHRLVIQSEKKLKEGLSIDTTDRRNNNGTAQTNADINDLHVV